MSFLRPVHLYMPIRGEHGYVKWTLDGRDSVQALANHGRTLGVIAESTGTSWAEFAAILEHRPYDVMEERSARPICLHLMEKRRAARRA